MVEPLNTPEGVLVRVKNKLSLALGINTQTLRLLIDRYVSIKYGKAYSKSHFDKVNTFGELTTDKMTIKVFFKYLRIIQIKKITIAITVTTARDKQVTIKEDIMMSVAQPQGDTDD
jgi:hypothetical protein